MDIEAKTTIDVTEVNFGFYLVCASIVWSDNHSQVVSGIIYSDGFPEPEVLVERVMEKPWQHWPWEEPQELVRKASLVEKEKEISFTVIKV